MSERGRAGDAGAAAVEFAIVLVVLVVITFGITELGRALFQENILTKAVNIGARYMARQHDLLHPADSVTNPPCDPQDSGRWSSVQQEARQLIVCGKPDSCTGEKPVLPGLNTATIDIASPAYVDSAYGGGPACILEVNATAQFIPLFGDMIVPFTTLRGFQLNAHTTERYIGE